MNKWTYFFLIGTLAFSCTSFAATKPNEMKKYLFTFKMMSDSYTYTRTAPNYQEAFETAASECFKYYGKGRRVSEDQGLAIIDVCANPKSKEL